MTQGIWEYYRECYNWNLIMCFHILDRALRPDLVLLEEISEVY